MQYRGLFIGLTTIDIQYFVDIFPQSNIKVKTNPPDILVGGPATNAAVAFSYLNDGANLATAIGDNSFTAFIQKDFKRTQIDCVDLVAAQKNNPVVASVITSENGARNIFTYNPAEIKSEINVEQLFETTDPQVILLDGFYPEFGIQCAQLAKENGIPVVLDCGSWKPQYNELLKYADVVICSADFLPPNCTDSGDVFVFLKSKNSKEIAISRGDKSILYSDYDKFGEIEIENTFVVDTLGAGDFLHGAFCYYYLKDSFIGALSKAALFASNTCKFKGTRDWLNK
ncbi:PfkB family carbohydrate kinase [uncultured Draconibacterium sp.]|uniref:PfkB family carbohydrate kinase n=1 Tax=uncultured Draconibacterium sp. TaxID=1573823 RepID=UPI0032165C65